MRMLYVIQHTQSEFLGQIEDHLEGRGIGFQYFRPFTAEGVVPGTAAPADGLILLGGGPWGAAPGPWQLPTLKDEVRLARDFLGRKRPVIGFGLGAQILALAAGGNVEPRALDFRVGWAERAAPDALAGLLPARWPYAIYARDLPVLPPAATVLAHDERGAPALFAIGANAFGFAGHPGLKPAIAEDLVMEFEESPVDAAGALDRMRAMQEAVENALVPIMAGLVQAAGLMQPHDVTEQNRRRMIFIAPR